VAGTSRREGDSISDSFRIRRNTGLGRILIG
jgi:hypothetical protein